MLMFILYLVLFTSNLPAHPTDLKCHLELDALVDQFTVAPTVETHHRLQSNVMKQQLDACILEWAANKCETIIHDNAWLSGIYVKKYYSLGSDEVSNASHINRKASSDKYRMGYPASNQLTKFLNHSTINASPENVMVHIIINLSAPVFDSQVIFEGSDLDTLQTISTEASLQAVKVASLCGESVWIETRDTDKLTWNEPNSRYFWSLKHFQQFSHTQNATVFTEIDYALVKAVLEELEGYRVFFTTAGYVFKIALITAVGKLLQVEIKNREIDEHVPSKISTYRKKVIPNDKRTEFMDFIYNFGAFNNNLRPVTITVYTVAKYPDNHNHLLPLKLIKKLDAMSPQEFVKYVLEELTLEERESLMVDERQRRKSFQVGWPYDGNLSGIKMAQAGFYSVNDYDRVQCVFCRGSLHRWERDDVPMLEHARSFNFCRFVKGLSCGNIEYRSDKLTKEDMRNITKFNDSTAIRYDSRNDLTDSSVLGISTNRAAMIEYAVYESRLKTFSRWPKTSSMTPKALCEAGFYYTGFDDMVRCFYCAGAIREWAITDDPCVEHARWFPDCAYLTQVKSIEFVDHVHATTPAHKKSTRQTKAEKVANKKADQAQTTLEDMIETCITLGHDQKSIKDVISQNGGPFEKIGHMIDAIYAIENPDGTVIPEHMTQKPKETVARIATDSLDSKKIIILTVFLSTLAINQVTRQLCKP